MMLRILVILTLFAHFSDLFSDSTYYYNNIQCCRCFLHCDCFDTDFKKFAARSRCHPSMPEDVTWHVYLTQVLQAISQGPTLELTYDEIERLVGIPFGHVQSTCMLPDYLERIEEVRVVIEKAKNSWINSTTHLHSFGIIGAKEKDLRINRYCSQAILANKTLDETF